ncbi:MAG TPA: hypothetical protein PKA98_15135, partial [Acidimicrobiales bacterium]|nr:hypothetical protein [Acidimicrobiales bacterium]
PQLTQRRAHVVSYRGALHHDGHKVTGLPRLESGPNEIVDVSPNDRCGDASARLAGSSCSVRVRNPPVVTGHLPEGRDSLAP